MSRLFILLQHLLPQHVLSRLVGRLADCRVRWVKNTFIRLFNRAFKLNMAEAQQPDPLAYPSFNAFFTRALKADARPLDPDPGHIVCPADGCISQLGSLEHGRILQAKGHSYSVTTLLGGDSALAEQFNNGRFATIYLSPRDYHRVHMPLEGRLRETLYVPGDLFSVNKVTADGVPNLFARNERLVTIFDTPAGPMAMVLVGAMIVAGIETVWSGQEAPPARGISRKAYQPQNPAPLVLAKGEEMGRFKLGSTVILLFGDGVIEWAAPYREGTATRLGETLAELLASVD